ncbi:unnamed protein product [Microthlaspi erraticum]|uniref:Uncharacterized protein n=1 Tax=Microthlaspi erraticum TaxID=1685480 RepID=A0A6D2J2A8_9BRAS|nr:unnamed protein product [Microthlaspi erraticum]
MLSAVGPKRNSLKAQDGGGGARGLPETMSIAVEIRRNCLKVKRVTRPLKAETEDEGIRTVSPEIGSVYRRDLARRTI